MAAIITAIRWIDNRWLVVPVAMLGITLGLAAHVAADSHREREMPSITLTISRADDGLTLTGKSRGSGLRSNERMLTRIVAIFRPLAVAEQLDPHPRADGRPTSELWEVTGQQCRRPQPYLADPSSARLLSWTETGPTAGGESAAEHTMPIPPTAHYVCAYVILSDVRDKNGDYSRPIASNFAMVDLADLATS
ncbi:hypothetical protein GCM10023170_098430 [Phytohabitans houttuyneae]|uniref:Uncharacterized protein n=2 Tax=Phytohabitans houttuyneae TaxID=1076126 RepID=A0A6V8K1B5_9ACTN|nr:hypothetical protein Phou_015600 [Phytohabitans houttuyneae]